ncbi:MAG: hypothetical protein SPJ04_09435 [Bdellovibrionota bacterium]|nr:hypothetical protein [Bdellovibrionota bacterium]
MANEEKNWKALFDYVLQNNRVTEIKRFNREDFVHFLFKMLHELGRFYLLLESEAEGGLDGPDIVQLKERTLEAAKIIYGIAIEEGNILPHSESKTDGFFHLHFCANIGKILQVTRASQHFTLLTPKNRENRPLSFIKDVDKVNKISLLFHDATKYLWGVFVPQYVKDGFKP